MQTKMKSGRKYSVKIIYYLAVRTIATIFIILLKENDNIIGYLLSLVRND